MYSYHTNLVWKIDLILLSVCVTLACAIVLYALAKEFLANRRDRNLLKIKRNVYELILSGQKGAVCPSIIAGSSAQQYLDVATNRNRAAAFFNESEQKLFKECFAASKNIKQLKKTAERSQNKWRRIEAMAALGYTEDHTVLPILKKALLDKDDDISYFSMNALGQIKTPASAKILLDFFKADPANRYKAISILENFPSSIADEAIALLENKDPSIRRWALKLLSKVKGEKYIKNIEQLTKDGSEDVRASACECLGSLGKKEAKGVLINCLEDEIWFVRMHAVKALSQLLGDECILSIIGLIRDNSWYVIESVRAVMADHIEKALPHIEKFLYEDDEIAKKCSVEALEKSGYIKKLLKNVLTEGVKGSSRDQRILEGIVRFKAHLGLEAAIADFDKDSRRKIFEIIKKIDAPLADHLEKKIDMRIVEL